MSKAHKQWQEAVDIGDDSKANACMDDYTNYKKMYDATNSKS